MEIKLLKMLFFIICASIEGTFASNNKQAEAECKGNSGLASYRHFVGDESSGLDKAEYLKEDESAWISGYVNFSRLVAYYGCYSGGRNSVFKSELQENNIYNCLQDCLRIVDITYIGLLNKFCYCANTADLAYFNAKPDIDCNPELIHSNLKPSSSVSEIEGRISIYIIIDKHRFYWDPDFSVARGQCVKVRSDGSTLRYETDSCYSNANSFICTNSAYHNSLTGKCGLQNLNVCIFSGSNAWMKSFKTCFKNKGKLTPYVKTTMKEYLAANELHWTGIFRTFKIVNKSVFPENNVCLSVKNVNGKIVFDPADCSTEKIFICEDELQRKTASTSIKADLDTKTNSVSDSSFFKTTVFENTTRTSATKNVSNTMSTTQTKTENDKPDLVGVYIAAGVGFTVAFIIIITCITVRKRKQLRDTSSQTRSDSCDNTLMDYTDRGLISDLAQRHFPVYQNVEDEVAPSTTYTALNQINVDDNNYDEIHNEGSGDSREATLTADTVNNHVYVNTTI